LHDFVLQPAKGGAMTDDEAWTEEQHFWTGGEEHYRKMLDDDCVMVFPGPAGIIAGKNIVGSLKNAPRWSAVKMTNKLVRRSSPDVLVLAYKAEAKREDADVYRAYCSSTYACETGRWRLIQHQQTPT
jgi:hypothetical protein